MPEWNEQANDIFLQAAEIADSDARRRYVVDACAGDESLQNSVDELLKACEESGDFLERPLAQLPEELKSLPLNLMPELVGHYRILEELGEGGMGVVYRARQETPVQRLVALKIIKPGIDTRQIISRFEAERQVLAMMDHPNIARVYDAGATEAGRPYFVMELVVGVPITEFCDSQRLGRVERLKLFVDVCHAVQHAHQKGVIHRDLKPSNILISLQDGHPIVKVIDFGVAKAMGPHASDQTMTVATQWVGTPLYMSPEQASIGAIDIDTRSDVYSLGVLLYELLTGTTPFDAQTLGRTDELGKRRFICEYEPPYPSVRVTSLDPPRRIQLTGDERIEVSRLSRQLRGELDWIVMKALEKDRERRYDSVSALAADIERYLHEEPVSAGPPSQVYRLKKLAWRYRRTLAAGLAVLAALVIGATVAVWQAIEANRARALADDRLQLSERIRSDLKLARERADAERDRAKASSLESRSLLYASEMRLAVDAWKSNDVRRMREILARHVPQEGEPDQRGFEWYFLWSQTGVESQEVLAASRPLYYVRISPDQRMIATAGAEGRIYLFDATTLHPHGVIDAGQSELNAVEFSADSSKIYSGDDDGSLALWDVSSGELLNRVQAHDDAVFGVAPLLERNALMTGGRDHQLRVWDLETLALRDTYAFHLETIQTLAVSVAGGRIAAGSDDERVSTWDLTNSTQPIWVQTDQPPSRVNAVAYSADGLLLATAHVSGLMTIRDGVTGAILGQQIFPDALHSLAFTPVTRAGAASMWIAVGDRSGSVYLLPTGMFAHHSGLLPPSSFGRPRRWRAHEGRVYSMTFTGDGRRLLTAGDDGRLKVWDYAGSSNSRRFPGEVADFEIVAADQVATIGRSIQVSSLSNPPVQKEVRTDKYLGGILEFAADAKQIFVRGADDNVYSLSLAELKPRLIHRPPAGTIVGNITTDPTGRQMAVEVLLQSDRRSVVGVDFPLQPEFARIPCTSILHQLGYAPDGCVVFDQVKDILIVRPETGEVVQTLAGHQSTVMDFDFSPDGKNLASVSSDRTVRVWDWRTGKELWQETAHENEAVAVAFTPDGETVATVGRDAALRLWRWRQNTLVLDYQLIDWPVNKIAFSDDGMKLLVQADSGLRVYDAAPDRPAPTPGHPQ